MTLKYIVAALTGAGLSLAALSPASAAPVNAPAPAAPAPAVVAPAAVAPAAVRASADNPIETMVHWSCDRTAKATVKVAWRGRNEVRVAWKVYDSSGGSQPNLKILGKDFNGAKPAIKQNYFSGDGKVVLRSGPGTDHSGGRIWKPSKLNKLDEVEVWIWNGGSTCGPNVIKRLNDRVHSATRTEPTSYKKSKALRQRIRSIAFREYNGVNHEYGENCSKYNNYFTAPNICQAWCANFAWWVWAKAGVKVGGYQSSYTNDLRDEWRVKFKPLGGDRKPVIGDVMVQKHSTNGVNGHVGVVVGVDGWKVQLIHGNWSDRVLFQNWTNPFTYTSDGGRKKVIGFASPV